MKRYKDIISYFIALDFHYYVKGWNPITYQWSLFNRLIKTDYHYFKKGIINKEVLIKENYRQSPLPRDINQPVTEKNVLIFDVYVYDCIFIIE